MSSLEDLLNSPCGKAKLDSLNPEDRAEAQGAVGILKKHGYFDLGKPKGWAGAGSSIINSGFEMLMGGLLNNTSTQTGSAFGNMAGITSHIVEKLASVPISRTLAAVGMEGKGGVVTAGEGLAPVVGLIEGLQDTMKFVDAAINSASKETEYLRKYAGMKPSGRTDQTIAEHMGLPPGLEANTKIFNNNAAITPEKWGISDGWWLADAVKVFGQYQRLAGSTLTSGDLYFKSLNFAMHVKSETYRIAHQEWAAAKAKDPDLVFNKKEFEARRQTLSGYAYGDPDDPLSKAAVEFADTQTFVNRPHLESSRKVAESTFPGFRWIAMIRRVPINVAARAFERSPVALLDPRIIKEIKSGDSATRSLALSRILVGTTSAILILATFEDNLIGRSPDDKMARELWHKDGYEEYSFRFDVAGKRFTLPFRKLGYFEPMLRGLADLLQLKNKHAYMSSHEDSAHGRLKDVNSYAEDVIYAFANSLIGDLWMKDTTDGLKALMGLADHGDDSGAMRFLADRASTMMVSNLAYQQWTKRVDPIRREAYNNWDRVFRRFPHISKKFEPVINFWGREVPWAPGIDPDFIDGLDIYGDDTLPMGTDPVVAELRAIKYKIPEMTPDHMNGRFNDQEYTRYKRLSGQGLRDAIWTEMQKPSWSKKAARGFNVNVSEYDHGRRVRVDTIVAAFRKNAVNQIMRDKESAARASAEKYSKDNAKFNRKTPARFIK